MKKPVKVTTSPAIVTMPTSGKRFIIAGSVWVEVPASTARKDLSKYVTWEPYEAPESASTQTWKVQGSRGDVYTVKLKGGAWSCSCTGFTYRRRCKHVTEKKDKRT